MHCGVHIRICLWAREGLGGEGEGVGEGDGRRAKVSKCLYCYVFSSGVVSTNVMLNSDCSLLYVCM